MTLENSTASTTENNKVKFSDDPKFKDDFRYLLEIAKTTMRNHEIMRNHLIRLGTAMAEKYFAWECPEMCHQIPQILTDYLNSHEIYDFDTLVDLVFTSSSWKDSLKSIEQSYQRFNVDYNNLLVKRHSSQGGKASHDSFKSSMKFVQQNPQSISDAHLQDDISQLEKTMATLKAEAIARKVAIPVSNSEVEQTRTQSQSRKAEQLKTPDYKIDDVHKSRQETVIEGLDACIEVFNLMRNQIIYEIPIQSDEEAIRWRDGFIDLANNFTALGDDKHRMDFAGWAKTLKNIEMYGAEKGLKMSGTTITPEDLELIDENTLPINHYPKYGKIGLSYISKEHLDSKGVIIANCFIDMINRFSWLSMAAEMFSYQAKIRGIRAIAVSHKLTKNR